MATGVFPAPATIPFSRQAQITSSTTWDHPDGVSSPRFIRMILCGGGSGGGSGRAELRTAAGSDLSGGSGGGSGWIQVWEGFISSQLTITIGAGGAGGILRTVTGSATSSGGLSGSAGGSTIVTGTNLYVVADTSMFRWTTNNLGAGGNGGTSGTTARGGTGMSAGGYCATNAVGKDGQSFGTGISSSGENGVSPLMMIDGTTMNAMTGLAPWCIYASGGGAAGGGVLGTGAASRAGGTGGKGFYGYDGGNGSASAASTSANGTATASAGSNAAGLGGGGGGGGSALVVNATLTTATATSGAGGTGGNGYVFIYY